MAFRLCLRGSLLDVAEMRDWDKLVVSGPQDKERRVSDGDYFNDTDELSLSIAYLVLSFATFSSVFIYLPRIILQPSSE